jgi:hypothetical protein
MKICGSFRLLRASPAMLSMLPLQKYFSHPSLVIYFFCNPTHDTQTEIANRWKTTNSKTSGRIIMIGQSKTETRSRIIFITLFSSLASAQFYWHCISPASANCRTYATNSKTSGRIIMIGQSKTETSSRIIFSTLFSLASAQFYWHCISPASQQTVERMQEQKLYCRAPNGHVLTFFVQFF